MNLHERIEHLTSSTEEYDQLYNAEVLYIAWANKMDDNALLQFDEAIDQEYYSWRNKLRGDRRSKAKIANAENNSQGCQGFVYAVDINATDKFEMAALMPSMKYSYRLEKYDLNKIKEAEKQEIIDKLTEENK